MSAHIQYNTDSLTHFNHSASPSDSVHTVLENFDSSLISGEHLKDFNFGSFYGGRGPFDGHRYSFESQEVPKQNHGHYYAFQADGDLHYDFGSHTLYGELDSVELGAQVDKGTGQIDNPSLIISFDHPLTATASDGQSNTVHQIVWGLMNGSVDGANNNGSARHDSGLVAELSHEGVDLNTALESVASPIHTAGIAAQTETDYALAA